MFGEIIIDEEELPDRIVDDDNNYKFKVKYYADYKPFGVWAIRIESITIVKEGKELGNLLDDLTEEEIEILNELITKQLNT